MQGDVRTSEGEPLAPMSPLSGDSWLRLGKDAELTVRHATSAREFVLRGPGTMLPCRRGEEQVLVESGSFHSATGTGARPGAEMWIGTPFGSARYGDADFELSVTATQLAVVARSGSVWTELTSAARGRPADGRITPARPLRANGSPDAAALTEVCATSARAARDAAEALKLPRGGSPGLGERAAAQMLLRQRARALCLAAAAAVPRLKDGTLRGRLLDQISRSEQLSTVIRTAAP